MSKRHILQQFGKRKKAKLDVSVSDHNFPLSQNTENSKEPDHNNIWGDEDDDEMLILASQACEKAISSHSISELPNYSMCMDPPSTSTQIQQPMPSTSKACFTFKVPSSNIELATLTSKLNDKCERISSPLPGISKVFNNDNINISEDLIFNNKIFKGQDSEQVYRQLLKLKEENEKLKLRNGKLLEECYTKEGEASILRTQLKTSQMAVDNARINKIKAQEKDQMDWSEKLSAANKQLSDLRTQLDFKNLEIISMKDKCKRLESNKVKLTQVMMTGNNGCMSQTNYKSYGTSDTQSRRKIKTTSNAVQTEDRSHFIKLNIGLHTDYSKLIELLPVIMEPTHEQGSISEYNDKLKQYELSKKCSIYTTFHRLPSTDIVKKSRLKFNLSCLYENLSYICTTKESNIKKCLHIVNIAKNILEDILYELENIQKRMTTAFTKEMDEVYMDATRNIIEVSLQDLLSGKALYKDEQGILARRITTVLVYIFEDIRYRDVHETLLEDKQTVEQVFVDLISRICVLTDQTTTAVLYSGLLLSITFLCKTFLKHSNNMNILGILKNIILSRAMGFVSCKILQLLEMFSKQHVLQEMCCKGAVGNLKQDYEQGVLVYKRDSCTLQILLKQVEAALKCIEKQYLVTQAVDISGSILKLYSKLIGIVVEQHDKCRCESQNVLMQVMVYALRICAEMWTNKKRIIGEDNYSQYVRSQTALQAVCQSGVQVLYHIVSNESDTLTHCEGHLLQLCEISQTYCDELHGNMISEIISIFKSATEESPQSYNNQAWLKSFQTFSIVE